MMKSLLLAFVVVLFPIAAARSAEPVDYTNIDPAKLELKFIEPKKDDKTGFLVGGVNSTKVISALSELAGRKIEDLEDDMRPGVLSTAGFLGPDEDLRTILAADNKFVVEERKLTHQQVARHMLILGAIGRAHNGEEFLYHGRKYKVTATASRGFQESPFKDGTKTNSNAKVENLTNGKTVEYSILVPVMVERYGFYEGKETKYRVEPSKVLDVLDFLKPEGK